MQAERPTPRGSAAPGHVPACAVPRTKNLSNSLESSPSLTFLKRNVGLPSLPEDRGALRTPASTISTAERVRFRGEKSSILCRRGAPSLDPLALCCGSCDQLFLATSRRTHTHKHTNTRPSLASVHTFGSVRRWLRVATGCDRVPNSRD